MQTTLRPDLAVRLRYAVTRTARRLRQEAPVGLTPSQGAALSTVEQYGPLTPSELAQRERVQRPTVARMLAGLEERGLVQRAPDPADRRSALISLTPAGRALLDDVRTRKAAYLAGRLEELNDEERATLDRAAAILEALLEGDRA
jgi:DNA-binding MarR family transcriptional regulator